jgi:hypothetical protein
MENRIADVERLLHATTTSDHYVLLLEVECAEAGGRDLLREMAAEVDRQILAAEVQAEQLREGLG